MTLRLSTSKNHYPAGDPTRVLLEQHGAVFNEYDMRDVSRCFITFSTIGELEDFVGKYGSVVLNQNEIEIYDSFRE